MDLLGEYTLPDAESVIHLAARVGGVSPNTLYVADFLRENILMNINLLHACLESRIPKVVSLLSTCIYPAVSAYPLVEKFLHAGPPHASNYGYAYAKRMLEVQSRAYRDQYGCNFICAIPNNLYGEHDNYDLNDSHVIPALTRKIWEAKIHNKESVEVWGDGTPLREFTYAGDIARILLFLLETYDGADPINIGYTQEYSIAQVVGMLCEFLEYEGKIEWQTSKPTGQYRKPSCNLNLLDLGWRAEDYTPLEVGLRKTCRWVAQEYPAIRGVDF
jgi:GDP-L-fucose synthase